ncbi:unnamed protein product [Amoebophrya sp. A25]|nr:unnamed protein product [Amoebophrya sp. A25]|eukprot:GSA25T00004872001.1
MEEGAVAAGASSMFGAGPNKLARLVQDGQHAMEKSVFEFEALSSITEQVAFIRQQRQEQLEQMVSSFLRVHRNTQRELKAYVELLHETHALSVDPQASRNLFWKQSRIATEAKADAAGQPEYFIEALRDYALKDDFMTHVFVRTAQKEKMAENVAKLLEEQLKKISVDSEDRVKKLREASLTALDAINHELLMKKKEEEQLLQEKEALKLKTAEIEAKMIASNEELKHAQQQHDIEIGRRMQLEDEMEAMRVRYQNLESELLARKSTIRTEAEAYGKKIEKVRDEVASLTRENKQLEKQVAEAERRRGGSAAG